MESSVATLENIVLIGFMGSGKSTVGRELHHLLGYPWLDMDLEIEARAGKSVAGIFQDQGEEAFRAMETRLLRELGGESDGRRIISTGGGAVVRPENRPLLRALGFVVWLDAPPAVIFERTARNRDRPLLQTENPAEVIARMLGERAPWYRETAHLKVDTAGLDSGELAAGILESARYFFTREAR